MIPYYCHQVIQNGSTTPLKDKSYKLQGASLDTFKSCSVKRGLKLFSS